MYFAVVRIRFEHESNEPVPDRKEMSALLEKLRAKFRIVVMPYGHMDEDGEVSIAYTSLAQSEESLNRQLDAVSAFCEEQGFGRIADEAVLMDHIDSIGESDDES